MNTRCFYSPRTKGSSSAAQPGAPTTLPPAHCGRPINALTTFLNMWQKYINREFMGTRLAGEGRVSCVMHLFRGFSRGAGSRCELRSPAQDPGDSQSLRWIFLRAHVKCSLVLFVHYYWLLNWSVSTKRLIFCQHKSQFLSCSVFPPQRSHTCWLRLVILQG